MQGALVARVSRSRLSRFLSLFFVDASAVEFPPAVSFLGIWTFVCFVGFIFSISASCVVFDAAPSASTL